MNEWTIHVLRTHQHSLISTIIEYFLPLERTNAWIPATHSLSQNLFPALWVTDTLYGDLTRILHDTFLTETQWRNHIPLNHILSQPSPTDTLAQYITAFTQRLTRPLTTLDHQIVHRLTHITGLLCRSHLMYHPGYLIDTIESHMEHYGTMLIRGLGHIIATSTPHITTHLTERLLSPPSTLYNIPLYAITLPQALPIDIHLNGILPSPTRNLGWYHHYRHSHQEQTPPLHMRPPYADSAGHVNILINVMEAELRGLFRNTFIPPIESHFHQHQVPNSTSTHNAYSSLIHYLYNPITEHTEHAKRHLRIIVLTLLTLPPPTPLTNPLLYHSPPIRTSRNSTHHLHQHAHSRHPTHATLLVHTTRR